MGSQSSQLVTLKAKICQETVSHGKTSSGQGRQTDRLTLKPSNLASVKVNYWNFSVSQAVKVPSPDVFAENRFIF